MLPTIRACHIRGSPVNICIPEATTVNQATVQSIQIMSEHSWVLFPSMDMWSTTGLHRLMAELIQLMKLKIILFRTMLPNIYIT